MLDAVASPDAAPLYRLQGLDRSLIGGSGLYLASNRPALAANASPVWCLLPGDWLGGGTLRNSFYAEPWLRFTRVRDLGLQLSLRGSFRLRVMQAVAGTPAVVLKELRIDQPVAGPLLVPVANLQDLPPGSRLFWHLEALGGGVLHEVNWCTRQAPNDAPAVGPVLAVLMRTWGRGDDLRALLRGWLDQAAHDAHLRAVLARIGFWVLDTTPGAERHWPDPGHEGLGLQVWTAPNLGGGGNASHLLHLFLQEAEASGEEPPELLILDDDLAVSLESLARHLALCAYRERDGLVSLPVLMKSRMTTVWEDGGLWGVDRLPPAAGDADRQPARRLAPQLIRHGLQLDGYEHLDAFGALNQCEYTTFIFLGLPTRCLRRIGLPVAFFLRGDDIEFCLRARALGLPVWTNPNLAAWHEPGHTPAQEYMAILHAVLTNLHHAGNPVEDYVRFFEQRLAEHAAIDDLHGLALYTQVLEDLLGEDSMLLTEDFAQHYQRQLPRWSHPAQQPLGEAERLRLIADRSPAGERLLLPFAYPGYHPQNPAMPREVWLHVPSAAAAWPVLPTPAQQRLALQQKGLQALQGWLDRFDALRAHWSARLQASGTPAFWQAVHGRCAPQTRRLHAATAGPLAAAREPGLASTASNLVVPQAEASLGDLRERLSQELAQWQLLRQRAERERPRRRQGWPWAGWWRRRADPARADAEFTALPVDWDPRQYLALNVDVARSGLDPAAHYLKHGRAEGRRYRS